MEDLDLIAIYDKMSYLSKGYFLLKNFPGREFGSISTKEIIEKIKMILSNVGYTCSEFCSEQFVKDGFCNCINRKQNLYEKNNSC